jgi:hypothetical protein
VCACVCVCVRACLCVWEVLLPGAYVWFLCSEMKQLINMHVLVSIYCLISRTRGDEDTQLRATEGNRRLSNSSQLASVASYG